MEVWLKNLPDIVSEEVLKTNLRPFTSKLGIDKFDCQKRLKATTGNIIFTEAADGERFLKAYGAVPLLTASGRPVLGRRGKPRDKPRLCLFNSDVFCVRGKKAPDKITLNSVHYKAQKEKEQRQWEATHTDREHNGNVVFEMWDLACGYIAYLHGACHFRQDISWPQRRVGAYGHGDSSPATIKFAKSCVILRLISGMRVEIALNGISQLVVSDMDCTLTFILMETPKFYETFSDSIKDIPKGHPPPPQKTRVMSLGGRHKDMVGANLVYRVQVHSLEFATKVSQLKRHPFLSSLLNCRDRIPLLPAYQYPNFPPMDESLVAFDRRLVEEAKVPKLPFGVLFQLQVMVWNNYLHPNTVIEILDILKAREGTPQAISANAIKKLLRDIPFPGPGVDSDNLDAHVLVEWLDEIEKGLRTGTSLAFDSLEENAHLIWIYKALVTPTHVVLLGPELEAKNRVLRKFPDHTDYFVRVQFGEEDGGDLRFSPKVSIELVYDRFKGIMTKGKGFSIGGRHYTFFGFSHSSLRSHSAWFQAPFFHGGNIFAYFNIISELGDFKKIRVVAKCAARIGQAFSETPYAVNMKDNGIIHRSIPDFKSPDGSRVFSDGVGTMSRGAMMAIWEALPGNAGGATVYQIRFGGSKGVLSLDARLSGRTICIRTESMQKFTSNDIDNLEICGIGNRPIRLVLNRQNIKILEDMGVPASWFLDLQRKELDRLQGVTKSVYNTSVFLNQQSIGDSIEFPKFLRRLERLGIDSRTDRLLCGIVEAVVLQELRLLKHKARIPVPDGITLYGVIDETGFLEEGEIYITFVSDDDRSTGPPQNNAQVLVTRSPALHPGDIQLAVNRIPPTAHPLRELNNCIVFNHKGNRDLPSMLSGGDLDGDMYHVIWDPRLPFDTLEIYQPADYSPPPPQDIGRNVERDDMAHFLIDFMKTDQLGLISVKHMILADQEEEGTVHQNCKILAELASTAVDFSKTGIPADVNRLREIRMNRARPDFLAAAPPVEFVDLDTIQFEDQAPIPENDEDEDTGAHHQYYESKKILGQLFRSVDEERIWHRSVQHKVKRDRIWLWQQLRKKVDAAGKRYQLRWNHRKEKALELRTMYEEAVQNAMSDNAEHPHKPLSEIEVFIGQVFNKRGAQTRRQRDRSDKIRTTFDRISGAIWRMIRERPRPDDESVTGSVSNFSMRSGTTRQISDDRDVLELALACFYVSLDADGVGIGNRYSQEWQVETFKVLAANIFLKELEMYQKAEEIRLGMEITSGGYVGVGRAARGRQPLRHMRRGGRREKSPRPTLENLLNSSLRLVPPQVDV